MTMQPSSTELDLDTLISAITQWGEREYELGELSRITYTTPGRPDLGRQQLDLEGNQQESRYVWARAIIDKSAAQGVSDEKRDYLIAQINHWSFLVWQSGWCSPMEDTPEEVSKMRASREAWIATLRELNL